MNLEDIQFEKKYKVYLEMNSIGREGYRFLKPNLGSEYSDKPHFCLTYHFKQSNLKNPMIIIDIIEGEDFPEQVEIIQHFRKHHALEFAVEMDGLDKITKGDMGI